MRVNKGFRRGDIWIVNFDPTSGHEQRGQRPAVIVSSDMMNTEVIELAFVMPGTTKARLDSSGRPVPNHVRVDPGPDNNLTAVTFFMAEQLRSVSTGRFTSRIGKLSEGQLFELEEIVIMLLDLGPK